jgi:hypothetical protein
MVGTRPQGRRRHVFVVFAAALVGVMAMTGGPAAAHDPIILGPGDATAADGPLLPDGTISFALYGVIEQPGDTRGVRARFAAGDPVRVTVLIPDLTPENALDPDQLPTLVMTRPDGSSAQLGATVREPFAEPFTGTNYITYIRLEETAEAGEYAFTVQGEVPARFTVAIGEKEQFGTPVEGVDDRAAGLTGVQAWYATAPPVLPSSEQAGEATTGPDVAIEAYVANTSASSSTSAALWVALGAIVVATVVAAGAIVVARRVRSPG